MGISLSLIRQIDQLEPVLKPVLYAILEEIERQNKERVTRDDFLDLKETVKELVQAQARTETVINQLAEAQNKTEARLESLGVKVEQLAEAQAKTEIEVRKLAKSQKDLQKQVGGLSDAVGYGIEDKLIPHIPNYARLEYGLVVDSVERKNVIYDDGRYDEVNILAIGSLNGEKAYLIGECKARPGKKDADRFSAMLNRLSNVFQGRIFPILIGYTFAPEVEKYIIDKYPEIKMVKSYAVEMRVNKK